MSFLVLIDLVEKIKKKGGGKSNARHSKAKKEDLEEQDEKADKVL